MIRYVIRRILGAIVVVWIVSVVTFAIFQLAPKLSHISPIYYYIGKQPQAPGTTQYNLLQHAFGFDRPLLSQYWHWLTAIFHFHNITDGVSPQPLCSPVSRLLVPAAHIGHQL